MKFNKDFIKGQTPVAADFVVTKTVTTTSAVTATVVPTAVALTTGQAVLTVPVIAQAVTDQAVAYSVAYTTGSAVAATAYTVAKIPAVNVVSITALNQRQIKVVFNKAVDSTTATTIGNYYENLIPLTAVGAKAELQSDNKTVIVTFAANKTQGTVYSYTVSGVKSTDLTETTASGATSITFLETTLPSVTGVKVTGNQSIQVTFNEPIDAANLSTALNTNNYTLDGYSLTAYGLAIVTPSTTAAVTAVVGSPGYDDALSTTNLVSKNNVVDFTFAANLPSGTHTFGVVGGVIPSSAGFFVPASTFPITVAADTTTPAYVSSTNTGLSTLDIVFNKPVQLPSIANIKLNGVTLTAGTVSHPDSTNLAKVEITGLKAGANTLVAGANVIQILTGGIVDYYGNSNSSAEIRFAVTAAADTTPPTIATVTSANDTTVAITFSEVMNATAGNPANYAVITAAGTSVATPATVATTDNTTYTLTFSSPIAGGSYIVTASNVQDAAGNTIVPARGTVSITDSHTPSVVSATVVDTASKQVKLVFSEAMNYTTITTLTNYLLNGSAVPAGTTVTPAADNTSVVLAFPAAVSGNITTILLKDVAGNFETSYQEVTTINNATYNAPILLRATATSTTTLVVEYKNPISYLNFADFKYNGVAATSGYFQNVNVYDKTAAGADSSTLVAGTKISLTFPSNTIDTAAANAVTLIAVPLTHDALGNAINTVATNTGVINSINQASIVAGKVVDKVAPTLVSETIVNPTTVTLTFSENLQGGLATLYKNDFTVVNGGATDAIDATTVATNTITLTLDRALVAGQTTVVTPKTVPTYVQDGNGNLYVPTSTDLAGLTVATSDATFGAAVTTDGVAATSTETAAVTVTAGTTHSGFVTVTVDGVAHNVALAAGLTATQVAHAIALQLTADTMTGWTVADALGVLTFTSKTANTNVTNIVFTAVQ